jgi:hypothetical protein
VFSAQLAPVVSSDDARLFGLVKSKQVAVIPARVDYTIALDQVGRDRMKWDAANKTLSVRLPLPSAAPTSTRRAQYLREGVWITRDAQDKLTRDNTRLAEQIAVEQAGNPVLMNLARGAAKEAIRQNLAIPLQVAGYGEVKVVVLFDGEPIRGDGRHWSARTLIISGRAWTDRRSPMATAFPSLSESAPFPIAPIRRSSSAWRRASPRWSCSASCNGSRAASCSRRACRSGSTCTARPWSAGWA